MKKILSYITTGLLLLGAVSCVKEEGEKIVLNPDKGVKPVLESSDLSSDVVVNFTPAVFYYGSDPVNAKLVYHRVQIVKFNGKDADTGLQTKGAGNTLTVKNTDFLNSLYAMGAREGEMVSGELAVRASVSPTFSSANLDSEETVPFEFEFYLPKAAPYKDFNKDSEWSLIGVLSAYDINWNGDLAMFTDGTTHVAAHVALKKGEQVKFRKNLSWNENFGGKLEQLGEEFEAVAGGDNLVIPEDGVYDLYLDPVAKTAHIDQAFDPYPEYTGTAVWTVIGKLMDTNWDADFPMMADESGNKLAIFSITLAKDDEFKFRKDLAWGENLGGEFTELGSDIALSQNGANIKPEQEGLFDAFVDLETNTAVVSEGCGLRFSSVIVPEEPEETKPEAWSVIGHIGEDSWATDFDLSNIIGDTWVIRSLSMNEGDEFKLRADHDWAVSVGGSEKNATSTINPDDAYDVFAPTLGEAFATGDMNIRVPKTALYDITFDYAKKTILLKEHVAVYSLIGKINGDDWKVDVEMSEENGVWTSPVVNIAGGFKIRYDYSWDSDKTYGAAGGFVPSVDEPFAAEQPGSDISIAAGDYRVQFTPDTKEIVILSIPLPEHLYMIGAQFGDWTWTDAGVVELTPVLYKPGWGANAEGQFYTVRYFEASKGFKFCAERAWNGDFDGLDTNEGFSRSNGNCYVAEDGFYMVHIDMKNSILHIEPARIYGLGDAFGGVWSEDQATLFEADGTTLKATTTGGGKLRMYAASSLSTASDWWTREFSVLDGQIAFRLMDELAWPDVLASQTIVLDFNAGTGAIQGDALE